MDRVAGVLKVARNAKRIAHLDIDRARSTRSSGSSGVTWVSCPKRLQALTAQGRRRKFAPDTLLACGAGELKRVYAMNYDRNNQLIQPYYVIEKSTRLAGGEAIISTGVANTDVAAQYCDSAKPRLWLTSGSRGRWVLPAGPPSAPRSPTAPVRHRYRRRLPDPHEHGELEPSRPYDLPVEGRRVDNFGDGMVNSAEAVPQGALSPVIASLHKEDSSRPHRPTASAMPCASTAGGCAAVIHEFIQFPGPRRSWRC